MTRSASTLSWDDIRLAGAIGIYGSLSAAATALGVNQSTMTRRLAAIELTLGVTLFDRRRSGYVATAAGDEVTALARRIESDVLGVTRRLSGHLQGHAGELRVTTSDILLRDFLAPIIADFQTSNPGIRLEISVRNEHVNLARAEADIAFRATAEPPENLFGRKVARIAWTIYGARSRYVGQHPTREDLLRERWVSYHGSLERLRAWKIVEEQVPAESISHRVDSVMGAIAAILAGGGVGYLPCMHGDLVPGLVRVAPVDDRSHDDLWVLTHPDIRRSDRVTAFMSHCIEAIVKARPFIEGEGEYLGWRPT